MTDWHTRRPADPAARAPGRAAARAAGRPRLSAEEAAAQSA
ncbi:hypothetical protein ABZ707_00380 [Streptomyces sp. NPDC006923]